MAIKRVKSSYNACGSSNLKRKLSKFEKASAKYWMKVLEERRLTLLTSTIRKDLSVAVETPATIRLLDRVQKRMLFDDLELHPKALHDFQMINEEIADGHVVIRLDDDVLNNAKLFITTALEKFTSRETGDIQNSLNMTLLLSNWRYGPGASIGCTDTHFVDKILDGAVSCTERAAPLYSMLRKLNPHCRLNDENTAGFKFSFTEGSVLSSVPKNKETRRTICTEPLANMALQLAAGMYIEGALHCCGIDLADQQVKNRRLAFAGSKDGALSTIDLKSASDYITKPLIKALWPPEWFALFMAIRSPCYSTPEHPADYRELHMMSTMGNGFTFPMMTLTLLSLVYGFNAKQKIGKSLFVDLHTHAVFGDDIIVPSSSFAGVCEVLRSAGLKVNESKSYAEGPFRESCGGDYHRGEYITPFYVESLRTDSEIYVVINKVLSWCSFHDIYLPTTLAFLKAILHRKPLLVPEWESPDSGILTMGAPHRFRKLVPIVFKTELITDKTALLSLIIIGGYVETRSDGSLYYTRRTQTDVPTRYKVEDSRYPKSYLDASDPSLRSPKQSLHVSRLVTSFMR